MYAIVIFKNNFFPVNSGSAEANTRIPHTYFRRLKKTFLID